MKLPLKQLSAGVLALAALTSALHAQAPVSPTFTYQGKLQHSGDEISATADFQLKLYDAATAGSQIGSTQTVSNVSVVDGLFTIPVSFGSNAFNGNARWLQIAVRTPAGAGSFVPLTPRQPITAVPYALSVVGGADGHSLDAADGQPTNVLYVNNAGNVGIGTTSPLEPLDVRAGNGSYFRIDGLHGDLHMNGGDDGALGLYNDSQNPNAYTGIVVNNWPHLVVNAEGNVGIGTLTPIHKLQVYEPVGPAIASECDIGTAVTGQTFGSQSTAISGAASATTGQATGVSGSSLASEGIGVRGQATNPTGVNYGVWGYSLSSSGYDFYAAGSGVNYGAASSRRWKHNIEPIDDPLDKLAQLRGVTFDWDKDHGGHHDVGMIAEEVGAVLPEIVQYETNGIDAHGMDYSKLTPVLVEAINALRAETNARFAAIELENAELRRQIAQLTERVRAAELASQ